MTRTALVASVVATAAWVSACASPVTPPPPVKTGFLSTYGNLDQVAPNSWRYLDPNNRLGHYEKFVVRPVTFALPDTAAGQNTTIGDIEAVMSYMRKALVAAIGSRYQVVDGPGPDVCEIRVALTDAYNQGMRVGIAMEGEMLDSVSSVQIAALVESQVGRNLTTTRFWQTHDAKAIMDGWAARAVATIDAAHDRGAPD